MADSDMHFDTGGDDTSEELYIMKPETYKAMIEEIDEARRLLKSLNASGLTNPFRIYTAPSLN